jgi:hypothetical protein
MIHPRAYVALFLMSYNHTLAYTGKHVDQKKTCEK